MTLFLFEYEERKLYGVYEATCDGALDIDPGAFTSSGKYFTAQVWFNGFEIVVQEERYKSWHGAQFPGAFGHVEHGPWFSDLDCWPCGSL